MSALAAPQISLEQARQLVEYLENGEQEKADKLILVQHQKNNQSCLLKSVN